ncbi:MAG: hypothetical protein WBN34_05905 [Woeseia sp.]
MWYKSHWLTMNGRTALVTAIFRSFKRAASHEPAAQDHPAVSFAWAAKLSVV